MEDNKVLAENTETKTDKVVDTSKETKEPTVEELQAQITKLKAENDAKDISYNKLKASFDKTASETSKLKKDLQARMTDDEVKKIEDEEKQQAREKEFEEMKTKLNTIEATKRYLAFGLDEKMADACAKAEIESDQETILKNLKSHFEAELKKKEAEWLNNRPDPQVGGNIDNGETDPFLKGFNLGTK